MDSLDAVRIEGSRLNVSADRQDASRAPLRDHVATSVRRYLRDLDGCDTDDLYNIALRELEIPLFAEVLKHCDGNPRRDHARHPSRHPAQETQGLRALLLSLRRQRVYNSRFPPHRLPA
jgi:Fis family transcriptional regulator